MGYITIAMRNPKNKGMKSVLPKNSNTAHNTITWRYFSTDEKDVELVCI
jgi:hypothetical protein